MDCRHERGRSSPRPKIGFIAVLHTWTQTLMYHPHIHCIVTGGGPNKDRWIRSRDDFFLPVRVMARLFRGKFLDELRKAEDLPTLDRHTLDHLYKRDWVVYCKPPFGSPKHVLAYLGRYTHRIAISNARITDIDNDRVRFRYRDPDRPGQSRSMDLPPSEFLRRFLTHVLPSGFVKIRYYGLLANRSRQEDLKRVDGCCSSKHQPYPKSLPDGSRSSWIAPGSMSRSVPSANRGNWCLSASSNQQQNVHHRLYLPDPENKKRPHPSRERSVLFGNLRMNHPTHNVTNTRKTMRSCSIYPERPTIVSRKRS